MRDDLTTRLAALQPLLERKRCMLETMLAGESEKRYALLRDDVDTLARLIASDQDAIDAVNLLDIDIRREREAVAAMLGTDYHALRARLEEHGGTRPHPSLAAFLQAEAGIDGLLARLHEQRSAVIEMMEKKSELFQRDIGELARTIRLKDRVPPTDR